MADFNDDEDFLIDTNTPEENESIKNYIEGKFEKPEEITEDLSDPMRADQQVARAKAIHRKQNPSIPLILARAKRDKNRI